MVRQTDSAKGIKSRMGANHVFGLGGITIGSPLKTTDPNVDTTPASSYFKVSGGAVFAVDNSVRANGMTPDQMGLPYAMQLLSRGAEKAFPGIAAAWWANPPVIFVLAGALYALPEPNTIVGGAVPILPPGLQVQYNPSFFGQMIPPGMPNLNVVANSNAAYQNKLRMSPVDIQGYPGGATNSELSKNNSFLLVVLEAAFGPVINAYSAYPYASDFGGSNNMDDKMFNHRNADDLLQPSIDKSVLQTVAPVAAKIISFVPGVGTAVSKAITSFVPPAQTSAGPQVAIPTSTTLLPAPSSVDGTVVLVIAAIIVVVIIIVIATSKR